MPREPQKGSRRPQILCSHRWARKPMVMILREEGEGRMGAQRAAVEAGRRHCRSADSTSTQCRSAECRWQCRPHWTTRQFSRSECGAHVSGELGVPEMTDGNGTHFLVTTVWVNPHCRSFGQEKKQRNQKKVFPTSPVLASRFFL